MRITEIENFDTDKALKCIKSKEIIEFKDKTLILASASKVRKEILEEANVKFVVIPNILNEDLIKIKFEKITTQTDAEEYVKTLSKAKAESISSYIKNGVILSADTIAFCDNEILEKPKDESDARRILNKISNSKHVAITGVCIIDGKNIDNFAVVSDIVIHKLPEEKIAELIKDKNTYFYAGGYCIGENIGGYVDVLERDFNNIMGLPIEVVIDKLKKINVNI